MTQPKRVHSGTLFPSTRYENRTRCQARRRLHSSMAPALRACVALAWRLAMWATTATVALGDAGVTRTFATFGTTASTTAEVDASAGAERRTHHRVGAVHTRWYQRAAQDQVVPGHAARGPSSPRIENAAQPAELLIRRRRRNGVGGGTVCYDYGEWTRAAAGV